jgi:hypothetical protein
MLLDGQLRVMPAPAEQIQPGHPAAVVRRWLEKAEQHARAGRIPLLRPETRRLLMRRAESFEHERGGPLAVAASAVD